MVLQNIHVYLLWHTCLYPSHQGHWHLSAVLLVQESKRGCVYVCEELLVVRHESQEKANSEHSFMHNPKTKTAGQRSLLNQELRFI